MEAATQIQENLDPSKLQGHVIEVPLGEIRPNEWNPQEMSDREFNALAESMQEGMIDPIQVVPLKDDSNGKKYVILGGEHRWRVAETLGWETIPCMVLTAQKFQETDLQKFVTLRLNIIHGKLNPEKFRDLYEDLVKKYDHESLQQLMGFTDSDQFDKLVGGVKDALKGSGLPPEMINEFAEVVEEMKTVDDLSNILNRLFTKYGDTLKYNFMVYTYGGKDHLYVKCDAPLFKKVRELASKAMENQVRMSDVLSMMFDKVGDVDYAMLEKVTATEEPNHFEAKVEK